MNKTTKKNRENKFKMQTRDNRNNKKQKSIHWTKNPIYLIKTLDRAENYIGIESSTKCDMKKRGSKLFVTNCNKKKLQFLISSN